MSLACTDEQRAAISAPSDTPLAIIACPGSGKTFTIIHRVSHLLTRGFHPYDLLLITFTRKAAHELRLRLSSFSVDVKNLNCATFHSFGLQVLRKYGHLLRLQNFSIISQFEQMQLLTNLLPNPPTKDILLRLQIYKSDGVCDDDLRPVFDRYNDQLRRLQSIDFTDLIVLPLELFQRNPEVLDFYRRKYKYGLVDEMQDVSKPQFDIMKLLFGDLGRLTVVGDDDQTIYGWRGASARLLLDFQTTFPNASIVRLTTCFRCPPHIVSAMSHLIQNNHVRVKKSIHSHLAVDKRRKITIYGANSLEEEAILMANDIAEKAGHGSIAVLFRTRKAASAMIGELRKRRLHSSFADRARFLDAPEVRAVLSVLQMCAGLSYDAKVVTEREIRLVREYVERNCEVSHRPAFLESDDESPPRTIESMVCEMRIATAVSAVISALHLASDSLGFLVHEAEENCELKLLDFIDHVRLTSQQENGQDDGVHLSTVHQAKGLEWDYVYVIGVSKSAWPSGSVLEDRLEEERRLFYVAMSRAKRELQISFLIESGPSPFILELPEITIRERLQKPGEVERASLPLSRHPAVFHSVRDISIMSARQLQLTSSSPQPPHPRPRRNIGPPQLTLIPSPHQPPP